MVRQIHELALFHGEKELARHAFLAAIDLEDVETAEDLLNGHLVAAAIRAGAAEDRLHEYAIEVYGVVPSKTRGDLILRWALPFGWRPEVTP